MLYLYLFGEAGQADPPGSGFQAAPGLAFYHLFLDDGIPVALLAEGPGLVVANAGALADVHPAGIGYQYLVRELGLAGISRAAGGLTTQQLVYLLRDIGELPTQIRPGTGCGREPPID